MKFKKHINIMRLGDFVGGCGTMAAAVKTQTHREVFIKPAIVDCDPALVNLKPLKIACGTPLNPEASEPIDQSECPDPIGLGSLRN